VAHEQKWREEDEDAALGRQQMLDGSATLALEEEKVSYQCFASERLLVRPPDWLPPQPICH